MVDLAQGAYSARAHNTGSIVFLKPAIFFGGLLAGMIFANHIHKDDYTFGYEAGRQESIRESQAQNRIAVSDLKKHGLCQYADLACGYYHNPNPPHQRRP